MCRQFSSNDYYLSDPGDETQDGIFDYFTQHPSAAIVYDHSNDWIDETDDE